ncbi:hypothetical protein EV182_002330, partial [Spiromyces aspiralis]
FDTPIINADEDNRNAIKNHIRDMLAPIVKSGTADRLLSKCIMVGVNPVSLGELGSGLNNARTLPLHYASMKSYPTDILKRKYSPYQIAFGFTEDEVRKLIATRVFPDNEAMVDIALNVAQSWYDGYYVFKNFRIYNPWSVMKFIKSLTEDKTCSNKAEVLANAQPYWIDTGSTEMLTEMYDKIIGINPSISRVILRMYLDYFNLKNRDTTEPSDSPPQTSIWVELVDSLTEEHLTQVEKPCFDERTKHIEVVIASSNRDAMIKNQTLDKFMTMAYYYGYLTIIGGKYLAIPNREMLSFWAPLVSARVSVPCESFMVRQSRMLMRSLVSENRGGFCDAIKRNFLDHLIKADARAQEYYYHEMMYQAFCLSVDHSRYSLVTEFPTIGGKSDICLIPKAREHTGFIVEIKRTDKYGVMDGGHSSGSADAGPGVPTDAASAASTATTSPAYYTRSAARRSQGIQESPHAGPTHEGPQQALPSPSAGSGRTAGSRGKKRGRGSTVDLTRLPYSGLKACLKVGVNQIEENNYLAAFTNQCDIIFAAVIAFCAKQYLVTFNSYEYDESKLEWVQRAEFPSDGHECSLTLSEVMAPFRRSNQGSSTGGRSNKKARGSGKKTTRGKGKRGGGN